MIEEQTIKQEIKHKVKHWHCIACSKQYVYMKSAIRHGKKTQHLKFKPLNNELNQADSN